MQGSSLWRRLPWKWGRPWWQAKLRRPLLPHWAWHDRGGNDSSDTAPYTKCSQTCIETLRISAAETCRNLSVVYIQQRFFRFRIHHIAFCTGISPSLHWAGVNKYFEGISCSISWQSSKGKVICLSNDNRNGNLPHSLKGLHQQQTYMGVVSWYLWVLVYIPLFFNFKSEICCTYYLVSCWFRKKSWHKWQPTNNTTNFLLSIIERGSKIVNKMSMPILITGNKVGIQLIDVDWQLYADNSRVANISF